MNPVDAVGSAGQQLAASVTPAAPPEQVAQKRELVQAVRALNATEMFGSNSELSFTLDRETRRPVVRIVDRNTNEVIQQIPPEYVLRIAEELKSGNSAAGR